MSDGPYKAIDGAGEAWVEGPEGRVQGSTTRWLATAAVDASRLNAAFAAGQAATPTQREARAEAFREAAALVAGHRSDPRRIDATDALWCCAAPEKALLDLAAVEAERTAPTEPTASDKKAAVISALQALHGGDPEEAHKDADDILLTLIGDEDIKRSYDKVPKWYA